MFGSSIHGNAVVGRSTASRGVVGQSESQDFERGAGVLGQCAVGVRGEGTSLAAHFRGIDGQGRGHVFIEGDLGVFGNLSATGLKSFIIDHLLDSANKYLTHVCVEEPDRKNVYDGVVTLNQHGTTEVELPEWFEELNGDFRYQLTAIGAPAPELHIAEEISGNRFKIAGGESGIKVSWQVIGIRKDKLAEANPDEVEQEKPAEAQGNYLHYLHPQLCGEPEERAIGWPGMMLSSYRERGSS